MAPQRPSAPAPQRPSGMTCAGRPAGAARPVSPAHRVSGSDPRRRRSPARLSRALAVLGLSIGALSLFAGPAAQAQVTTVWSATLTVKEPDGDRGCYGSGGTHGCPTALDDDDFTLDGTSYDVFGLIVAQGQGGVSYLNLLLSKTIPDALKSLKLCVGATGFALSDGTLYDDEPANDDNAVRWSSNSVSGIPGWSVGDTVQVSLASSCALTFGFAEATYLVKENVGSFVAAVEATKAVAADTTITIAASDGTSTPSDEAAERGTDYGGAATFEVTMTAGSDRVEFTQVIHDDNAVEPVEKFTLTITGATSGAVGTPASAVVTISDQDVTVQFASASYEVAENSSSATTVVLTVTPISDSDFSVGLGYTGYGTKEAVAVPSGQPQNNCADNADWDHLAIPDSVTFLANQARVEIPVTACDNADYSDNDESFELSIEIGSPYDRRVAAGARASTTVTIRDDDHSHGVSPGMPALTPVEDGALAPTSTTLSFTVSCVSPGSAPVTDYVLRAQNKADPSEAYTQNFPGPVDACDTLTVTMDGLPSRAEATTYRVRVYARNLFARRSPLSDWVELATTGTGQQVGGGSGQAERAPAPAYSSDPPAAPDPLVTLTAGGAVTEGASARFTLSADPAPGADLSVAVSVAQSGEFAAASALGSRTVTIPAGAASAAFTVPTVDDNADEPDGAIAVSLSGGAGYSVGGAASATVAVADDDEPPLPGIEADRTHAREAPGATVRFSVVLSHRVSHTVTVDYATADGAGNWIGQAPATAGADYAPASGTLTFAPGQWHGTVDVAVLDDAIDEGTEYFLLRLSNPQGAYLESGSGEVEGLIRNADPLQKAWLSRFGRTVGTQVSDAVTGRLEGPEPAAHVTVAGQRLDLNREDSGQALAETVAGIAQLFAAQSTAEESGGPFAAFGPADSGPADGSRAHGSPAHSTAGAGNVSAPRSGAPRSGPADGSPADSRIAHGGPGARGVTNSDILLGSSFHVAWGRGGNGLELDGNGLQRAAAGSRFAAWGRVAQARFDGAETGDSGRTQLGGEVLTRVLGADADFGRVLAGVALSQSDGEGAFDNPGVDVGNTGRLASTMTAVSPYVRVHLTERLSAWGLAGAGAGDMSIRFDGGALAGVDTGLSMRMGAAGARGVLLSQGGSGVMDLALKADALFVRTGADSAPDSIATDADTSRVRLVLEGGRSFSLPNNATLHPKLELGVRHDGGDAETGAGVELGGSVAYSTASGLSVEASARRLVAHADADYEEWGASAAIRFDPGEAGKGLSLSLAPTFGSAASGTERLWGVADARGLAPGGGFSAPGGLAQAGMTLVGQLGYGIESYRLRGSITPTLGYAGQHGGATLRFGTDYAANAKWLGAELSIGLGVQRGETREGADWSGELRATMRW